MSEPPASIPSRSSIGEELDALVAHLGQRIDRASVDMSYAKAEIEALHARARWAIAFAAMLGAIFGVLFSLAPKWIG